MSSLSITRPEIYINYAKELLRSHDAILLDIRTAKEYCAGHFDGAVLVETSLPPLGLCKEMNLRVMLKRVLGNCHHRSVVVYCKKGVRAGIARDIIIDLGFEPDNVVSIGGVVEPPLSDFISANKVLYYDRGCDGESLVARRFIKSQ